MREAPAMRESSGVAFQRTYDVCGRGLDVSVQSIGADLLVVITGGDRPHVGATATASVMRSPFRDGLSTSVSTHSVPGHKEYVLATRVAERLARSLSRTVTVVVGIHIDRATSEQIREVVDVVDTVVDDILELYENAE